MSFVLQKMVLPSMEMGLIEKGYYRKQVNNVSCLNNSLILPKNSSVQFDTYYNSFSITVWKEKTDIESLLIKIHGSGTAKVSVALKQSQVVDKIIDEFNLDISEDNIREVPNFTNYKDGFIYLFVTAITDCQIDSFEFLTNDKPKRDVKLGISITHFNRQDRVIPCIKRISTELLNNPYFNNNIKLVVVDNSKNLDEKEMNSFENVVIIPNENLGGAGGFTRGLLYLKNEANFTHCLFMDDDGACEIESLRRAYSFLSYTKHENTAISGTLLFEKDPVLIHEQGGIFSLSGFSPINHGLRIDNIEDLERSNLHIQKANYGAWCFFGFKISAIEHLAFPFFVRGDDTYFSLANKLDIATLNGVAVWIDDFETKEAPLTRYLGTRCTLVIFILMSNANRLNVIANLLKPYLTQLFSCNYTSTRYIREALVDFMKGPEFFEKNIGMKEIFAKFSKIENKEKMMSIDPAEYQISINDEKSVIHRLFRMITLNGILVPGMFFKNGISFQKKLFRATFREVFLYKKILYWDQNSRTGYVSTFDRMRSITDLIKEVLLLIKLFFNFSKLKKQYKEKANYLMSEDYWYNVLKIKK